MTRRLEIWGVSGIGEVTPGADLGTEIAAAEPALRDGDVVVVTSKVVSKAEGQVVALDRDAAIEAETVRVVAQRGATRIVQTRHGFVLAAAGVDASNVPPGTVALLPVDPDASARRIRDTLREICGVTVAVVVTDTFGRPWRNGLVDVAIGAAGIRALDDHRGRTDAHGRTLEMTVTAVVDEIAAAGELVKGKLDDVPVAVVRGLTLEPPHLDDGARGVIRDPREDMFRLGTNEAMRAALHVLATATGTAAADPVEAALAAAAVAAAPAPERQWQLVVTEAPLTPSSARAVVACLPAAHQDDPTHLLAVGAAMGSLVLSLAMDGLVPRWLPPGDADADALAAVRVPDGCRPVAVVTFGSG